jgi:hypothetical protein
LTGGIDLILASDFIANTTAKASTESLSAYQPKLISNSSEGRNIIMDDGKTVYAIDEGQNKQITPTFSIVSGKAANFRLAIKVTDAFTTQVNTNTTDITAIQTNKANTTDMETYTTTQIAAIPKPFWCVGKVNGFTKGEIIWVLAVDMDTHAPELVVRLREHITSDLIPHKLLRTIRYSLQTKQRV